MRLDDLTILVDSREQRPLRFRNVKSERATLITGDYSVRCGDSDLRDTVAIERKSIPDLVSSLSTGRERFEREMSRLARIRWRFLVIEGELREIAAGTRFSNLTPAQIISPLLSWQMKYDLHVIPAISRAWAARIVELLLAHCARHYLREQKEKG